MSPSWPERLVVGFAPDRISAVRLRAGWKPQVIDRDEADVMGTGETPWTAAGEVLTELLARPGWERARVELVLSNHVVHYAVVPAAEGLKPGDWQSLAMQVFAERYGPLADAWEIRLSPGRRGAPRLASAVPRALLAELQRIVGPRLRAIRPALMCVFNQVIQKIGEAPGHLALLESGRITLAKLDQGQWQSILSRAVAPDDFEALPRLIGDETQSVGTSAEPQLWLCNLDARHAVAHSSAWRALHLEPRGLPASTASPTAPTLAAWGL